MILNSEQGEDFASRILAAIERADKWTPPHAFGWRKVYAADRERVVSDLNGLRRHEQVPLPNGNGTGCRSCGMWEWCEDGLTYSDGLRRTAAPYGVTP